MPLSDDQVERYKNFYSIVYGRCVSCLFVNVCGWYTRFRVHLRVEDDSGATVFTMYNQLTERLIDSSAHKLLNRLGIGNNGFPVELCSLAGRTFAFNIKMPDYFNSDYDFHHHRVVRLSEIDSTPPPTSPATHPKKVNYVYYNAA